MKNDSLILPKSYYLHDDVVFLAKDLLGKKLCSFIGDTFTSGIIIETEAYRAPEDSASHAFNYRKTPRTQTMYQEGGTAYVYFIYGMYSLFNVITNVQGVPHGVLIRALQPLDGIEEMRKRRKLSKASTELSSGPGTLTQALGITQQQNGLDLTQTPLWIENHTSFSATEISSSPRIGLGKRVEEPYVSIPWRFYLS